MNKIRICFCVLFFIICALPVLLMPLSKQDTTYEKRTASELPALQTANGSMNLKFGTELETYLSEHFAFRAELVTANNQLQSALFGTVLQDNVLVGEGDWLYLADTLADYEGTNLFSARELHNTVRVLSLMQTYANSQGAAFLFVTPPNKNTLYAEAMPDWYRKGATSNLQLLTDALAQSTISYLDLEALFSQQTQVLYHKRDTHWNNAGAQLACNAILHALSLPTQTTLPTWSSRADWSGDLDALIYPTANYLDTQLYCDQPTLYSDFLFTGRSDSVEAADLSTESTAEHSGHLLVFRDSFGNALIPYLSSSVAQARYVKYVPYQLNLLEAQSYDAVVLELVERNLRQLLEAAPVMPAPAVTVQGNAITITEPSFTLTQTAENGAVRINGTVAAQYLTDTTDIYLLCTTAEQQTVYAAFPVGETGYSLLLAPPADSVFSLVLQDDETLTLLQTQLS